MKVFVCSRSIDAKKSSAVLNEFLAASGDSIAILREEKHSDSWKERVEKQLKEVDFVIFMLGQGTFESNPMKWEYAKAKSLNKQIVGIKLSNGSENSVLFCQRFPVFRTAAQCWSYLDKTYTEDRQLLLEQYKIMVGSTEKVTDQRMRVNNLFFTVTSSILSVSLVIGKAFEFSLAGFLGMLFLSIMAFIVTFFWEKLVQSYGKLNTGKFAVIDEIEKQLRTNMFENEWKILQKIGYEPNTATEAKVIRRFRWFILIAVSLESAYMMSLLDWSKHMQFIEYIKTCIK